MYNKVDKVYTFRAAFYTPTLRPGKWEAYFDNVYVNVQRTELIVESFLRVVKKKSLLDRRMKRLIIKVNYRLFFAI